MSTDPLTVGLLACALGYRALAKPKPAPKRTWTAKKKATPRNKKAPAGKRGKKAPRPKPAAKADERVAIEQWLATGAGTSPKTNELLENEKLLPNKALKALIVDELERRARARLG